MGTSRLSYVLVIAQVGKRGQGNSEGWTWGSRERHGSLCVARPTAVSEAASENREARATHDGASTQNHPVRYPSSPEAQESS